MARVEVASVLVLGPMPPRALELIGSLAWRRLLMVDKGPTPQLQFPGFQFIEADPMSYCRSRLENHEAKRATTLERFDLICIGDVVDPAVAVRFALLAGGECVVYRGNV